MAGIGKRAAGAYGRVKEWLMEYAYLVTLSAVIAVIVGAALYTDHIKVQQEAVMQATAQSMEIAPQTGGSPEITPLPTIAPLVLTKTSFMPRITAVRPVSGKITRAYETEPVRWETLSVLQAHEAIDVAGSKDESVLSAMDGMVTEAAMDALWGWRIEIEHTDGSTGCYAGLALSFVQAGDYVARGEEIGTLLESVPCEAELGPHLHLEWLKNGVMQDPEGLLPE